MAIKIQRTWRMTQAQKEYHMYRSVEQLRFQYLPLGVRLWRSPDKGHKYDRDDDARKVHKVFVTFSPRVAQMLRERKIKVDY